MSRPATQPLAIRCHRPFVPHSQVRRPMRPAVRNQMFGPLHPADPERSPPRWHSLVIVGLAIVAAYLCMTRGWSW